MFVRGGGVAGRSISICDSPIARVAIASRQPSKGRHLFTSILQRWATIRDRRRLERMEVIESSLRAETDVQLRKRSLALRYRAQTGEWPERLLVDAFGLVREAARRTLGMRHFDVQMLGGMTLARRGLAEMQTGEGKTLTASLPLYLFSLYGYGAQLATVNDYLARRDAALMTPLFRLLKVSVGTVESSTTPSLRRAAYACDITYGTAKEFGFDFLRDRVELRKRSSGGRKVLHDLTSLKVGEESNSLLQREPFFMLVDEADGVLIDDAGTPLIIAGTSGDAPALDCARFRWAATTQSRFRESEHFTLYPQERRAELTVAGRALVRSLGKQADLSTLGWSVLYDDLERAISVDRFYRRDRQYVVREGKIEIVDEFTGRVAEGRKWQAGLHQAIEAHENLRVTEEAGQAARITVQEMFRRYRHLTGMTGTVAGTVGEFRRIYRLSAIAIPQNKPPIRVQLPTLVFATAEQRIRAVIEEVRQLNAERRPILIGTRSIDKSEELSSALRAVGIDHEVLNARHEASEAEIVAGAGRCGRVTVATNMAGRGTDIKLDPEAIVAGGMHVILTEMHDAARIDRQLIGRCGRQGDPGSYRIFLSLEDELLRQGLGTAKAEKLRSVRVEIDGSSRNLVRWFLKAQKRIEARKYDERRRLMEYERYRRTSALPLGLDPYLDLPG